MYAHLICVCVLNYSVCHKIISHYKLKKQSLRYTLVNLILVLSLNAFSYYIYIYIFVDCTSILVSSTCKTR